MATGILGFGCYLPKYRIKRDEIAKAWQGRARGERTVACTDEDSVTMAAEACLNAVAFSGVNPAKDLDAIYLGTDSPPYMEHSVTAILKEVMGMGEEAEVADFTLSPRASFAALKAARDAIEAQRLRKVLVVGSDCRPPSPGSELELSFGSGAAAVLLGRDGAIATIEDVYTYSTLAMDRWRGSQEAFVRSYDYRYTREVGYLNHVQKACEGLLKKTGRKLSDFHHVVLQQPDERVVKDIAKKLKVQDGQFTTGFIAAELGDLGAASVLMGLGSILEKAEPGQRILAISYGAGTSDAISLVVTEEILKKREKARATVPFLEDYINDRKYMDYIKYLKTMGLLREVKEPANMAVPVMSPFIQRAHKELYRPLGNKCQSCGHIDFPPSLRKICTRCGKTEMAEIVLSKRGTIHTFCVNYYMPAPYEAPLPLIFVDLEDGPRYEAMGTEFEPEELKVNQKVELVLRVLNRERGATLYGYKVRALKGNR